MNKIINNYYNNNSIILFSIFFYIFFILIIPGIPTDTFNIDDKIFLFLQSEFILKNEKIYENYLTDIKSNCDGVKYCKLWVDDMFNAVGNYRLYGILSFFFSKNTCTS